MGAETDDLRRLPPELLEQIGQRSLREHLLGQARIAHQKYAPLGGANLETLLKDPDCLRYPVRLAFEFGEMAAHQFAQPDVDLRNPSGTGRVLYLRPRLRGQPELVALAVSYMIPVINYGEVVADAHCIAYGAVLLGLTEDEFYERVCAMADLAGVETYEAPPPCTGTGVA